MKTALIHQAFDQGQGILRLTPTWVPRSFCIPGRRIKLHPDDYYALGGVRGGIDERWLASTTPADNGPLTSTHEGLSHVLFEHGGDRHSFLFRDAVDELKADLIGTRLWKEWKSWPMYSKFFDNQMPLPFHIHHREEHARRVGQRSKPEAYYFPPQLNNHGGDFAATYFGLHPHTRRDDIRRCLEQFARGDNRITLHSRAYRLEPGTGWDVPPGMLHAPGSLCTYEPQRASDVFAMYQSVIMNRQVVPEELLWKDTPPEQVGDFDYLMEVIDWELNVNPDLARDHFMPPRPVRPAEEMEAEGYHARWICYRSDAFSAQELTILPGCSATIKDAAAYGMIMMQGHGMMGHWQVETPALIRFGQTTRDEFFVSETAAREGVLIRNDSDSDPLVMLKHYGPGNPDLETNP
ncbi:MAG: hypothetical protein EA425_09925 [Puniceicoccaceae bacterium]|nr:MAG: hypothetical protein EA425_09925 [Puniceicoccaceae bacterium]